MVADIKTFLAVSIPSMLMFGMRHALDVDHITAIDNLIRLHNAKKRARWVGTGFSMGHMISVLSEMILIIYVIGSASNSKQNWNIRAFRFCSNYRHSIWFGI